MTLPEERARNAAMIAALLGLAAMGFAVFALVIVGLQRVFLSAVAPEMSHDELPVLDVFDALHGAWFVHMPIFAVLGALLLGTGIGVRRGSVGAGWLQLACVLAAVELCAYDLHVVFGVLPTFDRVLADAGPFATVSRVLSMAGALVPLGLALPFLVIAQLVAPLRDAR